MLTSIPAAPFPGSVSQYMYPHNTLSNLLQDEPDQVEFGAINSSIHQIDHC